MADPIGFRVIDVLMKYGMALPLTLTADSKSRMVRVLGLLWLCVWVIPSMALFGPIMIAFLAAFVEMSWKGTL